MADGSACLQQGITRAAPARARVRRTVTAASAVRSSWPAAWASSRALLALLACVWGAGEDRMSSGSQGRARPAGTANRSRSLASERAMPSCFCRLSTSPDSLVTLECSCTRCPVRLSIWPESCREAREGMRSAGSWGGEASASASMPPAVEQQARSAPATRSRAAPRCRAAAARTAPAACGWTPTDPADGEHGARRRSDQAAECLLFRHHAQQGWSGSTCRGSPPPRRPASPGRRCAPRAPPAPAASPPPPTAGRGCAGRPAAVSRVAVGSGGRAGAGR